MIRILSKILFFLTLGVHFASAQCLILVKSDTFCEKSTTLLPIQLLGPNFAIADSFLYELNGQSIDGSQTINWLDTGDYQIIVSSLNSSGQVTCIDTAAFFVAPLPQINYVVTSADTQCYFGNSFCIRNQSTVWKEDSNLSIHTILWGDSSNPFSQNLRAGESACHTYTSLQANPHIASIEITDQRGCKAEKNYSSSYLKGITTALFSIKPTWCGPLVYGGSNFTILFDSSKVDSFTWLVDSIPFEKQNLAFAYPLEISGSRVITLNIWTKDGCFGSFSQSISLMNPLIRTNKADTLFVKDATIGFSTDPVQGASILWTFGNVASGPKNFSSKKEASHTYINPGKYTVTLQGSLPGCGNTADTLVLTVTGPLARINPPAYTVRASCNQSDTVYLSQSSLYYFNDANPSDDHLAGGNRNDHVRGIWDFGDLAAPSCTTDTKQGIHLTSNCRYSRDSATKHFYGSAGTYTVRYAAFDTIAMTGTQDTLVLQFGAPTLDDYEIESNCSYFSGGNGAILKWNTISGRPQTTFRILMDSAADRNDNTPNVLDSWIDEAQTKYNPTTQTILIKLGGAPIHQVYIEPRIQQAFHDDGRSTIGLWLINGDTNSPNGFCDTIIWFNRALLLPRQNLGFSTTLTHYSGSDSLSWNLTDRRLKDISYIGFDLSVDFALDGEFYSLSRYDTIIRNHKIGQNTYDYILRKETRHERTTQILSSDSFLIRHHNGTQLVFQSWRDTLIDVPPTQFQPTGIYRSLVFYEEGCFMNFSSYPYILNGHLSALGLRYPSADTFLFVGDTLVLHDTMIYGLPEPNPLTGEQYDRYSYWSNPKKYADGRNRPTPPGGYETVEWKANGVTFSNSRKPNFIPSDTGWYLIEMITKDSTGRKQRRSKEVPVFGINPFLGLLPDSSSQGPRMEKGDEPQTSFNSDVNGLLINRDCDYFLQFEQQSAFLDPCIGRYGTPCLPEIKTGVREGNNGPISFFTNNSPVILPFNLLEENQYGLVYQLSPVRTIQFDTLIDLEISLDYLVNDAQLCNDEPLIIGNQSTGLGSDVQYLVYAGDLIQHFEDTNTFTLGSLQRGTYNVAIDAYPGDFIPGGMYCPVRTTLPTSLEVNGAEQVEITGSTSGSIGQTETFTAEIGHVGGGTYLWTIDNGVLLSGSNKDTVSAFFNAGNGKLMVAYTEATCPAVRDTLYFVATRFSAVQAAKSYLYPNPTKGVLHLEGLEGKAVIHIYTAQGAKVFSQEVDLNRIELDGLTPGLYFMQVEGMEGMNYRFILEE